MECSPKSRIIVECCDNLVIEHPNSQLIIVYKNKSAPIDYSIIFVHGLLDSAEKMLKLI